jgi:hypothetical protein
LASQDVCVLVNCALERDSKRPADPLPADFVEELGKFVKKGKGLIIFGGDNVAADPYNRILAKTHGLLPLPLSGFSSQAKDQPIHFNRKSATSPALLAMREDEDYKFFDFMPIWRFVALAEPPKDAADPKQPPGAEMAQVLLRYSNQKPALVSKRIEAGEVLLVTTSADPGRDAKSDGPTWNYLFGFPDYVPFVQALLTHVLQRQTQTHNYNTGEAFSWQSEEKDANQAYLLLGPKGQRTPLGRPERVQGRPLVTIPAMPNAGVYYVTPSDQAGADPDDSGALQKRTGKLPGVPFALVPDLRESADLKTLSDADIDKLLGFKAHHVSIGGDDSALTGMKRANREWTIWILAVVLLVGVGESALAWFCGRAW